MAESSLHVFLRIYVLEYSQVTLSEKYLVSVCSEYNHVRSWAVTRFRGMISTQPGSTPEASFKIVSLEAIDPCVSYNAGNDFGNVFNEAAAFQIPRLLVKEETVLRSPSRWNLQKEREREIVSPS